MSIGMRILVLGLVGLVALAGVPAAAAQDPCPECDGDMEGNNDCSFSSVDGGIVDENATVLADTDLCVGHSDTFEEKGFWAVFSICLDALLGGVDDITGVSLQVDGFVSQHGVDLEGSVDTPLTGEIDLEEDTPVGDVDDMTWDVLGDVDAQILHELSDDPHHILPGGEDLPTVDEDLCLTDIDVLLDTSC